MRARLDRLQAVIAQHPLQWDNICCCGQRFHHHADAGGWHGVTELHSQHVADMIRISLLLQTGGDLEQLGRGAVIRDQQHRILQLSGTGSRPWHVMGDTIPAGWPTLPVVVLDWEGPRS